MPKAYVLLNVESGSEDPVLKQLREISVVEEAHVSYGVYDLIVKVHSETMDEMKEAISHKIRNIKQVRSTLTLIIIDG
ncbi:MAG: Lrp/AsnC ligand binding domain-containing protein [Nitrososphaerota archaeon]|uniref:Lrp/AsnC family transcriptional regulator n=1 Tax=Candidatus Bathycorpusculum sp. TaxID=2994959 RepID=UPI00281C52D3|nr:Lrp/AsnC ligand binding domain-containing protein [Candidatus Termiticorpusculum sp.]MCL2257088.1 Lrp/AsnC ligand binding domain-containing protein [Candidatus Termiticorpusculum sp.]MCL2292767.1 Lrp/AsnC ligand binding domain-containing protein [Candidatus Termiticorpusculum sp.]MDR0461438.1 Lrp/AsnC ligand binding domain-containing protein [Nitrososphaerota archaeon]